MDFDNFGHQLMTATMKLLHDPAALQREAHERLKLERELDPHGEDEDWRGRAADHFVSRAGTINALIGGAASLPSAVPGAGTAVMVATVIPDLAMTTKLQIEMAQRVAVVYGYDLSDELTRMACTLMALSGPTQERLVEVVAARGTAWMTRAAKEHLKGTLLKAIKEAFKKVGIRFTRSGLVKCIPFFVGALAAMAINKGSTHLLGRSVKAYFASNPSPDRAIDAVVAS